VRRDTATAVRNTFGTTTLQTAPSIVIYECVGPYRTNEQIILYQSVRGWTAQLTGTEGKDITERLSQERWEELHAQALAACALLGRVPTNLVQEII
jgi:hypothetical protein